jgi:hypothetical protein
MISARSKPLIQFILTHYQRGCCLFLCLVLLAWSRAGFATESSEIPAVPADGSEAWLVTFGPGEIYWERFGHNAIWLREPAAGLDQTFNFGYFDFEQEDFLLRFIRGRMLYFSIAQAASREFELYRQENRSIRTQKLNLTPPQYQQLRNYLLNEIKPENRNYRYDYFLNNCSTRVRDALDIALDGALSARTKVIPAELNFRDQTRRLTQMQFWYYLGLELSLGFPVDRAISRWDEMFIPMVVADEIVALSQASIEAGKPLLAVDTMLFTASTATPAQTPATVWYRYLLLGLLVTGLGWLAGKFMLPVWLAGLCHAWVLISASNGLILTALWLLTDHEVARANANLLLLNPLVILALVPALRRAAAVVLASGVAAAYILLLFPEHQYNLDVLFLLTPINLAVAWYFFTPVIQLPSSFSSSA